MQILKLSVLFSDWITNLPEQFPDYPEYLDYPEAVHGIQSTIFLKGSG